MSDTPQRAKVNAAIAKAMGEIAGVAKADKNSHGGYNFASIDGFLGGCRGPCANHGLHPQINTVSYAPFAGNNNKQWATYEYEIHMAHESGEETAPVKTFVSLPITGAQTSGSAQSYALKQYLRGLFLIQTGERDDPDFKATIELELPNAESPDTGDELSYDLDKLETKIQKITSLTALNAWIGEINPMLTAMHNTKPQDYNRFYAFWKKQEKDITDGKT